MSSTCTCSRVRRASRILSGVYDAALADVGLSTVQFSLLRTLERLGPISITGLAEATAHDRSTLSRSLRLLEQNGLVRLGPSIDGREREVALAREGSRKVAEALSGWTTAQRRVEEALGADAEALHRLLARLEGLKS